MSEQTVEGLIRDAEQEDKKPYNPAAFPEFTFSRVGKVTMGKTEPGMTLRDYFAAAALKAFLSNEAWVNGMDAAANKQRISFKEFLAKEIYVMADQMLEARAS